ncbi:MAG TPA: hypothetical protein P5246_08445 [Candidatus Omnitrophota bacterium]|nr:hypothetical protein [Candidatus Omnitrophota bacterium]HSA30471.1 hypothetical protein [Candidatus Omnitrophota bacterium]
MIVMAGILCFERAAPAQNASLHFEGRIHDMTGEVVRIDDSWIYIKDEHSIDTVRFFVHPKRLERLKVGDRVRVYYQRRGGTAFSIKKMSVVSYEEGQKNLGYVQGRPEKGEPQ